MLSDFHFPDFIFQHQVLKLLPDTEKTDESKSDDQNQLQELMDQLKDTIKTKIVHQQPASTDQSSGIETFFLKNCFFGKDVKDKVYTIVYITVNDLCLS